MKVLLGIFIVTTSLVLTILIIFLLIKKWLKNIVGESGMNELSDALKNAVESEKESYSTPKSLAGMTNLVLPRIQKDIPDFNYNLLYSKVESDIKRILQYKSSCDELAVETDHDLIYLSNSLKSEISDLSSSGNYEKFEDVKVNKTVIKSYKHVNGAATIMLESSAQYKYDTNIKGKRSYKDINKQTRYITEYVYVYDEEEFNVGVYNFAVNCPNCGAPVKKVGGANCDYCGTYVEPINLKNWFIASCKEK